MNIENLPSPHWLVKIRQATCSNMNTNKPTYLLSLLAAITLMAAGCSSKSSPGPKRVNQKSGEWDHKTVRETREAEKAQTPTATSTEEDEENCIVMSQAQMKRAKASGCRKMDAREGHGEGTYCCPRN